MKSLSPSSDLPNEQQQSSNHVNESIESQILFGTMKYTYHEVSLQITEFFSWVWNFLL